jgi:type VI protein secretion system component VasF
MPEQSMEVQVALLMAGMKALEAEVHEVKAEAAKELSAQNAKITALEDERNKALRWGVLALGSAVLGMAGWIFSHLTTGRLS